MYSSNKWLLHIVREIFQIIINLRWVCHFNSSVWMNKQALNYFNNKNSISILNYLNFFFIEIEKIKRIMIIWVSFPVQTGYSQSNRILKSELTYVNQLPSHFDIALTQIQSLFDFDLNVPVENHNIHRKVQWYEKP